MDFFRSQASRCDKRNLWLNVLPKNNARNSICTESLTKMKSKLVFQTTHAVQMNIKSNIVPVMNSLEIFFDQQLPFSNCWRNFIDYFNLDHGDIREKPKTKSDFVSVEFFLEVHRPMCQSFKIVSPSKYSQRDVGISMQAIIWSSGDKNGN